MKTTLLCVLLGLATAVLARADAYEFKESFDTTHPLRADGAVSLENINGNVEVRSWDRAEIRVQGEKSAETEEELKLIEMNIDPQPNRARITVKLPKRDGWLHDSTIRASVRFTLTVPTGVKLDEVRTVNGDVTIEGVRGSVHAGSVNGRIKAVVSGDANLSTVNGGVEARMADLASSNKVSVRCVNGGITLLVPQDSSATLNATSVNGGISCDFPITVSGHFMGRSLHGKIGGGGAEIKATTVNGGIKIRKS